MIYRWKSGTRVSVNAQAAGDEIERIRVRHNGILNPAMVVETAKDPENVLHPAFEWNDQAAAEAYRTEQAKYLIRHIEVVVENAPQAKPIRAFVSVVREEDRSYTSVVDAMSDPELRRQVLDNALRELEAWRERHAELNELAGVFAAIDQARAA